MTTASGSRAAARRRAMGESRFQERFGLFAEALLTGVWIALAALPLVTYPAAFAAGARHLRRHLSHRPSGFRQFAADVRAAARRGWLVGAGGWVACWLAWLHLSAVRAGLPGGPLVGAAGVLALCGAVVAGLRAAAVWEPGASWRALLAAAGRRTVLDPAGSFLLVGGVAVVAVSAWAVLPLAVPVLGAVAAGAIAVEERYGRRADAP
ncbi:hypothetical protein [Streptomyces sp. CA-132043]|uniref:hypothetical protein n=1 Tax=Streptomyces sp. CA-132043 TaxID=3240048 RepID=UPI003D8DE4F5